MTEGGVMPTHYVEDYEELTGKKREKPVVEVKVVTAPEAAPVGKTVEAETKTAKK
jgi:hypothetical protein